LAATSSTPRAGFDQAAAGSADMPSLRLAVHANRADTKKYKLNYAGSIGQPAAWRRARIGCAELNR
jgi:hypothetical protein